MHPYNNTSYDELKRQCDQEEKSLNEFRRLNEPIITAYLIRVEQLREMRALANKKLLQR